VVKVALEQVFLQVIFPPVIFLPVIFLPVIFPPVSIIPPALHTELYLKVALIRKKEWEKPRKILQKFPIAEIGDNWKEFSFTLWVPKTLPLSSPLTSVNIDQSTQSNIPEGLNFPRQFQCILFVRRKFCGL